jgi:hypothetical protein
MSQERRGMGALHGNRLQIKSLGQRADGGQPTSALTNASDRGTIETGTTSAQDALRPRYRLALLDSRHATEV